MRSRRADSLRRLRAWMVLRIAIGAGTVAADTARFSGLAFGGGQSLAALDRAFASVGAVANMHGTGGPGQSSLQTSLDHTVGDDLSF